jgi:hypothetical protein
MPVQSSSNATRSFVGENVRDGVGLPLKELLAACGALEGFFKIGHRTVRSDFIRRFRYGNAGVKNLASVSPVAPLSIAGMYSRAISRFVGMGNSSNCQDQV